MTIPPPTSVRIAALIVAAQGVGLWVLAGMTLFSGISHGANGVQLGAQTGYFALLGAGLGFVASGLLRGRRWARTPAIVAQVVVVAIGMWMAFPSDQLRWGLVVIVVGAVTLALLINPMANHWIRQFPAPFGIDQDH